MQKEAFPRGLNKHRLHKQNQAIPNFLLVENRYTLKFASTKEEIDEVLRLRFNIFNLELGEGLTSSFDTFRDEDQYDCFFNHLIITDNQTKRIIGTYRMQTYEVAVCGNGFYSQGEFKLEMLPKHILRQSVEIGRACVDKNYRNSRVLFLLWRGLTHYIHLTKKRYLFGCGSLTSQDSVEGWNLYSDLLKHGHVNRHLNMHAQKDFELDNFDKSALVGKAPAYPPLLKMYLRYGAKIVGDPAIDRDFKTIDYFILLDTFSIPKETFRMFLGEKDKSIQHRFKRFRLVKN